MVDRSGDIEVFSALVHELIERVRVLEYEKHIREQVRELATTVGLLSRGDTAWMLAATALVFFMTIPGTIVSVSWIVVLIVVITLLLMSMKMFLYCTIISYDHTGCQILLIMIIPWSVFE